MSGGVLVLSGLAQVVTGGVQVTPGRIHSASHSTRLVPLWPLGGGMHGYMYTTEVMCCAGIRR